MNKYKLTKLLSIGKRVSWAMGATSSGLYSGEAQKPETAHAHADEGRGKDLPDVQTQSTSYRPSVEEESPPYGLHGVNHEEG